jgi:hypothetical protein
MKTITFVALLLGVILLPLMNAAAQGQMSVGAGLDLMLPVGAFGDAWGTGFGGTAEFDYSLSPHSAITGKTGYISWSGKSGVTGSCSGVPLLVGLKYYTRLTPPEGNVHVYGHLELGLTFVSWSVTGHIITVSETETSFTLVPSIGAEIAAGPKGAVDVSVRYYDMTKAGGGRGSIGFRAGYKLTL